MKYLGKLYAIIRGRILTRKTVKIDFVICARASIEIWKQTNHFRIFHLKRFNIDKTQKIKVAYNTIVYDFKRLKGLLWRKGETIISG